MLGEELVVLQLRRLLLEEVGHRRCVLILFVLRVFFEITRDRLLVEYRVGGRPAETNERWKAEDLVQRTAKELLRFRVA